MTNGELHAAKTVETYKTLSMEKLNTRSRVELVRFAADRSPQRTH